MFAHRGMLFAISRIFVGFGNKHRGASRPSLPFVPRQFVGLLEPAPMSVEAGATSYVLVPGKNLVTATACARVQLPLAFLRREIS